MSVYFIMDFMRLHPTGRNLLRQLLHPRIRLAHPLTAGERHRIPITNGTQMIRYGDQI